MCEGYVQRLSGHAQMQHDSSLLNRNNYLNLKDKTTKMCMCLKGGVDVDARGKHEKMEVGRGKL